MAGQGYPMVATHDPRLVEIAGALAVRHDRAKGTYEYQMLYGVRPDEQLRLAGQGEKVRVYLPYGDQWYGTSSGVWPSARRTSRCSCAPSSRRADVMGLVAVLGAGV